MTQWLRPDLHTEELPRRPVAIRVGDPAWALITPRRVAAYVESSILHGLQWVALEPNDEALWNRVRGQVEEFMDAWSDGPGRRRTS